jgi:hypothetical protein
MDTSNIRKGSQDRMNDTDIVEIYKNHTHLTLNGKWTTAVSTKLKSVGHSYPDPVDQSPDLVMMWAPLLQGIDDLYKPRLSQILETESLALRESIPGSDYTVNGSMIKFTFPAIIAAFKEQIIKRR